MAQASKTFRVFISSTFSDLKAERNALQERVFPRLRALCQQHEARFQPIDLRWGVSEEASLDQQAMAICLGEIARCQQTSPRPNFIVLLGDRYGWCPPPSHIPDSEFREFLGMLKNQDDQALLSQWYQLDENAKPPEWRLKPRLKGSPYEIYDNWQPVEARLQAILAQAALDLDFSPARLLPYIASATEQEIASGALMVEDAPEHVFCFFRSLEGLPMEFNAQAYRSLVERRLKYNFPSGLNNTSHGLVNQILGNPSYSSVREFAEATKRLLKETPKATPESDVVSFVRQVLVDFTAKDFQNLDEEDWTVDDKAHQQQRELKTRLQGYIPHNIRSYSARWTGDAVNGETISTEHIDQLCADMYDALSRIILDEIEHPHSITAAEETVHIQPSAALDTEGHAHHKFAEDRVRVFVGRQDILAKIANHLSAGGRRCLTVVGGGGTGKSTLVARAIQETQISHPDAEVVYRFIGVTPGSSDGRSLLDSLCHELSRRYGADVTNIPTDYRDLVPELSKRMALATGDKPLILFLDSLDQLSNSQNARSLIWLPSEVPEHVYVITTTRPEDTLKAMQSKQAVETELGGLARREGEDLLSQWLSGVHRTLQPDQFQQLMDKFECRGAPPDSELSPGNPLYLKLAFEEARLWTSYSPPEELAFGVKGIVEKNMIDRMKHEGNHGEAMLSRTLGYLAASRYGLAEDELVDLLSRDLQVYEWFFKMSYHLPSDLIQSAIKYRRDLQGGADKQEGESTKDEERAALAWLKEIRTPPEQVSQFLKEVLPKPDGPRLPIVLWSRLSFDLAPYLTERMVDGSSLLNFYHRELGDVSTTVFLGERKDLIYHARLADYFRAKADPLGDGTWMGNYIHGLSELPHHLTKADRFEEVCHTLTNFKFLQAKVNGVGAQKLIEDYDEAFEAGLDSRPMKIVKEALSLSAHVLIEYPTQLSSQLTGRLLFSQEQTIRELLEQIRCYAQPWFRPLKPTLTKPGRPLLRTLKGHTDEIKSVAITNDGEFAVSVSSNGTLKTWELNSGIELNSRHLGEVEIEAMTVTDDKRYLAFISSWSRYPTIINLETWKKREFSNEYRPSSARETLVATSSGLILTNCAEGTLALWDPQNGEMVSRLKPHGFIDYSQDTLIHRSDIQTISISPDRKHLVSMNDAGKLTVWNINQCQELFSFHSKHIPEILTFNPDGKQVLSGTDQGIVEFWDLDCGTLQRTLHVGRNLTSIALSINGKWMLCGFYDGNVKIYDLERTQESSIEAGHSGAVQFVLGARGRMAVSFGEDTTLRIWDLGYELECETEGTQGGHTKAVWDIKSLDNGKQFVSTSADKTVCVWDRAGNLLRTLKGHGGKIRHNNPPNEGVTAIAKACDDRHIMTGDSDGNLRYWDIENGDCLWSIPGHESAVTSIAISNDGRRAISASLDKSVKVWNPETGVELAALAGHKSFVYSVVITPDGKYAVSASRDKILIVWDLENGKFLRALIGHAGPVRQVVISPDGKNAISAAEDRSKGVAIWDINQGNEVDHFEDTERGALSLAISADGKNAASGDMNGVLRIWDLEHRHLLHSFHAHTNQMLMPGGNPLYGLALAITPDGRHVLTASVDKNLKLWELSTGKLIAAFTADSSLWTCAVAKDSQTITVGDLEGRVHFLKLVNVPGLEQFDVPSVTQRDHHIHQLPIPKHDQSTPDDRHKVQDLPLADKPAQRIEGRIEPAVRVEARVLTAHRRAITALAIHPDKSLVFTGSEDGSLGLSSTSKSESIQLQNDSLRKSAIIGMIVCPESQHLIARSNNSILVWKIPRGNLVQSIDAARGSLDFVVATPDGRLAISGAGGIESTPVVWNLKTGKRIGEVTEVVPNKFGSHQWGNNNVAAVVSADGRWFIAGVKQEIVLWDITGQREIKRLGTPRFPRGATSNQSSGHSGSVANVALSPDGQLLASSDSMKILLWDLSQLSTNQQSAASRTSEKYDTQGTEIFSFAGTTSYVHTLEFVDHGRKLLCVTENTLRLFDVGNKIAVSQIDCAGAFALRASVSADSCWVTGITRKGQLRLWDTKTGKPVATFIAESPILASGMSADGTLLVAGEESGCVHLVAVNVPESGLLISRDESIIRLESCTKLSIPQVKEEIEIAPKPISLTSRGEIPAMSRPQPFNITEFDKDGVPTISCPVCQQDYPVTKNMLGKEINCMNPDCQVPLKLNVFVSRSPQPKEKRGWQFWKK